MKIGFARTELEVLVGTVAKLISNFTNGLVRIELDESVKPFAWTHPNERGEGREQTA